MAVVALAGVVGTVAVMLVAPTLGPTVATPRADVVAAQALPGRGEAPVETAPAGRLPPRPAEVDVHGNPPDGEVAFRHGLAWMTLTPGSDGQPDLLLVNGGDRRLELTVEALPVRADELGAPAPHDPDDDEIAPSPLPGADAWMTLAEPQVVLDPGERATIRPTVTVPDGTTPGPYLASLRARASADGRAPVEVAALLVVEVPDPDGVVTSALPRLDVGLDQRRATAAIELRLAGGEAVTAVTGRLEVRGWWGGEVATVDLPPVVVLPTTERVRELDVRPPLVPGRYTVTAVLETRDGEPLRGSGAGWLWHRDGATTVAVVLLVLATLALLRTHRRGRTGPSTPTRGAPDGP